MKRIVCIALTSLCALAFAQGTPPAQRIRGTIEKLDAQSLVIKDRNGASVPMTLGEGLAVTEVVPVDPATIQSGTFVGTTAVPGADGGLSAVEVHVFPEAARGTGEGHRPWDLMPGSTMTNATVTAVKPGANERTMTLHYKDGEKVIRVPEGVPVVTMQPGDRALLVPGAKVMVTAQEANGKLVATRVLVGRNGLAPPM